MSASSGKRTKEEAARDQALAEASRAKIREAELALKQAKLERQRSRKERKQAKMEESKGAKKSAPANAAEAKAARRIARVERREARKARAAAELARQREMVVVERRDGRERVVRIGLEGATGREPGEEAPPGDAS